MSLTQAPSPATWSPSWLTAGPHSQPRCLPAADPLLASSPALRPMRSDAASYMSCFWLSCVQVVLYCVKWWKVVLMSHEAQRCIYSLMIMSDIYQETVISGTSFLSPAEWGSAAGWWLRAHPDWWRHQPDLRRHYSQYRRHRSTH